MSETDISGAKLDPVGRALFFLCKVSAAIGGIALVGIALMTLWSVLARSLLSKPIMGDFELVQLSVAVCVAAFLPYCQWQRANIIVDFFTANASRRTKGWLDALGAVLLAIACAFAGWRTGVGALAIKAAGETSMLMGVPVWISYAFIAPGLGLTSLVGFYTAWQYVQESRGDE